MRSRTNRLFWLTTLATSLVASGFLLAPPAGAIACTDTASGQLARWAGDGDANEVAHGRDGTLVGDTTFTSGEVSSAFSFDGAADTVTVPHNPDWTLAGDFTVDTWVNFAAFNGHSQVFLAHDPEVGLFPKWLFWYAETGELGLHVNTGSAIVDPISFAWSPSASTWYHLAITRSGNDFALYVNGTLVKTATSAVEVPAVQAPLTLGSSENDYYLHGLLDEPEIYQRALNGVEVKAIFDAGGNARCAISQSTLSLTPPAWAYPDETLTMNGSLALSGGASASGQQIALTKSVDGGAPSALPPATSGSDGSFSFTDTPAAGTVVYRATFAGSANVSAENAYATVIVQKKTSSLSVSVSKSTVRFGDPVTVAAHLTGGFTNKRVTIWAVPFGSSKQKLAEGKVNSGGTLAVRSKPTRGTEYYATYVGDAHWSSDTSSSKTVKVEPRWSIKIDGGYATVSGVRLYHYSALCGPTNGTGCPAAAFQLSPNHGGQRVYYEGRYCHNGNCSKDSGTFRLSRKSVASVYVYYGDASIIGWTMNFRFRFNGDKDHTPSTSAWVKTRITA